jgi:hypothetical protein
LARENRSRRILHGNQEEGKKEETLTVCETILRKGQEFKPSLSGEAPLERRFLFAISIAHELFQSIVEIRRIAARPVSQY